MKKLISILFLCLWTLTMFAQTYSALWKQVETYQQKDQPKSAIASLRRIQQKSIKEKSFGNLLAAMIKEVNQQAEISEDSMKSCKARLKNQQVEWQKQGNGVLTVLAGIALGQEYSIDSLLASPDAEIYTKSEKITAYVPFINKAADSKYFHNDLLHIIGIEEGQHEALYRYYSAKADRKTACIAAALMLEHGASGKNAVAKADSLIEIYKDLPECGAIALRRYDRMTNVSAKERVARIDEALNKWPTWKENNELRNIRSSLTQSGFQAKLSPNRVNTMMPVEISLSDVRNIDGVKVLLTNDNGQEREFSKMMPKHEAWDLLKDTIKLGRLPLGKWTVTITDATGKIKSERQMLFVTDLRIIQQGMPGDSTRYVVVNDITGQPVEGATLTIKDNSNASTNPSTKNIKSFKTDAAGEYIYYSKQKNNTVAATFGDDRAMPEYNAWSNYIYSKPSNIQRKLNIYTDRSIYRPGQTVHVAVLRHDIENGTETHVAEGDTVKVTLMDVQNKKVDEKTLITDEYGTATIDFTLPAEGRNGNYVLRGIGKANSISSGQTANYASIRVEEYKRPTFDVTLTEPTESYKAGDTVNVIGTAKTYSGVAIANARVTYTVKRQMAWWWRRMGVSTLMTDTVYTESDGRFTLRMPLPQVEKQPCLIYNIIAEATVMDNDGESHSASLSLPLSNRDSYISCGMKDKVLADTTIMVKVERRNASGKLIEGEVKMILDGKALVSAKANQSYALPNDLLSGEHKLQMICGEDTLQNTFVVFRKSDVAPITNTKDWFYVSSDEFTPDGTWMQLGTIDRNVHVVYAVYSADKTLEKGVMTLNGNNITRTFKYKQEYGDGIRVSLVWVKNGKMYSHSFSIKKLLESKKLTLQWSSFRNKLVPGQKETWSLKVESVKSKGELRKAQDTKPKQLMAVLYDKSLDALQSHSWNISDQRYISLPTTNWSTASSSNDWFYGNAERKNLPETGMRFSCIAYDCRYNPYEHHALYRTAAPMMLMSKNSLETSVSDGNAGVEPETEKDLGLRSDFSETAFFMPQLVSDGKGMFTLRFTLPESVTTWKFMALAHDKEMRCGSLVDEAVSQKQLMLQAKMPRFLRVGDQGQITANVSNLTEKQQKVNVIMTLMDGKTEKVIGAVSKAVSITANGTQPVTFDVTATESMADGIICKFMAVGKSFSDGEQHLLPILTDKEEQLDTTSFIVEPKKMMLEALPQLQTPESKNAITLSNALYANVMAAHLKDTLVSAANDNVMVQLLALQNADGGFSWYGGMESSKYITASVVKTLVRMNKICGMKNSVLSSVVANTEFMLSKALAYLEAEMTKEMTWQKEHKTSYLSSTVLDWLYSLTLAGKNGGTVEKYFRKMLYEQTAKDDMQTKAVAGIVMKNNHEAKEAREYAEAIKQHTVYREDMGRYFDSYRAEYSWCDYKIPTQTMCIEALDDITPMDTTTITEMQRWLVQSKRTQRWDNAINAVNAVYALSLNNAQKPFMAAYKVNPEDYKDIIKVNRTVAEIGKVGDRVKVTITFVADRDYDFVTVTDNRAACMEPVNQMSGYHWAKGGNGYYQETKDNKTVYHFDQLRKGTHTIETEYYIDRAGSYNAGKTIAVCEYAPEFRGSAGGTKINIK